MEVQRLCSVLDLHLKDKVYLVNNEYTIADMAIFPWIRQLLIGYKHSSGHTAASVLSMEKYTNILKWYENILNRPAVQKGITVCPFNQNNNNTKPWIKT